MIDQFLSINFILGFSTKLIVNGSIDLVITRKNVAIFYSPQALHAATKTDPPLPLVTDWYLAGPSGRNNPPKEYHIYNDNQIKSIASKKNVTLGNNVASQKMLP